MDESAIFATVRRNLSTVMPDIDAESVTMDDRLGELGCNSIDRAEVVTLTMDELGLRVPVMEFQNASDIRGLVTLLARHAA